MATTKTLCLKYNLRQADNVIYADDRENEKLLHKLFMAGGNRKVDPKGDVMVKRLPHGDYQIGEWLIEAKEINDPYRTILGIGRNGRTTNHPPGEMCAASE